MPTWKAALVAAVVGGMGIHRIKKRWSRPPLDVGSDPVIRCRVQAHLRQTFGAKAEDYSVRVHRGRAVLRGEAASLAEIQRLAAMIEEIPGVNGVDNLLRLAVRSDGVLRGEPSEVGAWVY
ncbi:MAG: BON domain-containing protein [Candidatus Dormibacteria bacterium]